MTIYFNTLLVINDNTGKKHLVSSDTPDGADENVPRPVCGAKLARWHVRCGKTKQVSCKTCRRILNGRL